MERKRTSSYVSISCWRRMESKNALIALFIIFISLKAMKRALCPHADPTISHLAAFAQMRMRSQFGMVHLWRSMCIGSMR